MNRTEIQRVAVIGAGTMGHGIAHACAVAGLPTVLFDPDPDQLARARERIAANLDKGVRLGKVQETERERALEALELSSELPEAVAAADLVIEAAPERLELKQEIFRAADRAAPAHAILATNTSSLSVTRIAGATSRAGSVLGLHFFNPVHIMRLLEVVRGSDTEDDVLVRALAFASRIGKEPIVVTDTPGFASSRLGVVLGLEAMRMVEQGVASATDIDRAMVLGYNHPVGPLKLTDLVGLDVRLGIAEYLHETLGGAQFEPPKILRAMVAEGQLGRKTGRGFYEWEDA